MIVIGVDLHKHSLTAVAVDELDRAVAEQASAVAAEPLLERARSLEAERLGVLEDCRQGTPCRLRSVFRQHALRPGSHRSCPTPLPSRSRSGLSPCDFTSTQTSPEAV
jgi:hypothetical protein